MTHITKRFLRNALGPDTRDVAIAEFFGITQAAVSQWGENDPIPEKRALQAMHKRPDLFPVDGMDSGAGKGHVEKDADHLAGTSINVKAAKRGKGNGRAVIGHQRKVCDASPRRHVRRVGQ